VADAVIEMRRVAGTQLDPQCVEAFVGWLEKTGRFQTGADALAA
jgi:HD-GYP domain-containing protein (c-di-GMP phosphodiesterase class II)